MNSPRSLRCVNDCLSISARRLRKSPILSFTIRRSVSISVSPGPLVPTPPPCLSRCFHIPFNLGRMYWYWASSTWVLAWAVLARLANMSRIRSLRSMVLTFSSFSIFWICEPVSSSSKMTMLIFPFKAMYCLISSSFPFPTNVLLSGCGSFCVKRLTAIAPAVSARKASSSRYSFTIGSVCSL